MSNINTKLPEQFYLKREIHSFSSEKSVLIEVLYYYPVGPGIEFNVTSWAYGNPVARGAIFRDGRFRFNYYKTIPSLTDSEEEEIEHRILAIADTILEMVDIGEPV
ncbi:hypothetical protein [Leptospira santarosai]|uniref:hypothetical protein n=1 Tax=Leptospira santarosai TaxID=28183 RepID=UPI0024AF6BE1|nr:hypothetical protein [Leptospira santarosai]MDI7165957.1 hypothetical protein [Leptospira santarosai]